MGTLEEGTMGDTFITLAVIVIASLAGALIGYFMLRRAQRKGLPGRLLYPTFYIGFTLLVILIIVLYLLNPFGR